MGPILYLRTIKDRIKLRLLLQDAADLKRDQARADRTSDAWVKLHQRHLDMRLQAFMLASKLLAMGADVSRPATAAETRAAGGVALALALGCFAAAVKLAIQALGAMA